MMIVRKLSGIGLLVVASCAGLIGCGEDNEKQMLKTSASSGAAPAAAPSNEPPAPPANDAEARRKYEMDKQAQMYKNYPGYNTKGR